MEKRDELFKPKKLPKPKVSKIKFDGAYYKKRMREIKRSLPGV